MTGDPDGVKVFRAAIVLSCIGAAMWIAFFAAFVSWAGLW